MSVRLADGVRVSYLGEGFIGRQSGARGSVNFGFLASGGGFAVVPGLPIFRWGVDLGMWTWRAFRCIVRHEATTEALLEA